jgi:DNA-directed RNA polymerase specialized sigma24 family protein
MTAEGLARLLARLDPDAERAALEYERLRRTLLRFFDWRGVWPPEECADEALDRLARRLESDTAVEDVPKYLLGIARMVLLEQRRQPTFDPFDDAIARRVPAATVYDEEHERTRECLDRCLAELPPDSRSLLLLYYEGERGAKIANHRRLAATLGLSDTALRSRVQRLRNRIERCMAQCARRNQHRQGEPV